MKHHSLNNVITTLNKLRDEYHSQLSASSRAELDNVLEELTRLTQSKQKNILLGDIAMRSLRIIDTTIRVVSTLTDQI